MPLHFKFSTIIKNDIKKTIIDKKNSFTNINLLIFFKNFCGIYNYNIYYSVTIITNVLM